MTKMAFRIACGDYETMEMLRQSNSMNYFPLNQLAAHATIKWLSIHIQTVMYSGK